MADLRELLESATYVLFDFDGPVCRLFARHEAHTVAADLVDWLREQGQYGSLTVEEAESRDPHAVLRGIARAHPGSKLVESVEARLTEHELRAASGAEPTPSAEGVIRMMSQRDYTLAITTNNSAEVARSYLSAQGLADFFAPHIHGRTKDPLRLKPDPDCLFRALDSTGATASESLMIGDTPADCHAARKAGVAFLGYGRNPLKVEALREAGAGVIVSRMAEVLKLMQGDEGTRGHGTLPFQE